jgi:membrane glycosyltransferase
MGGVPLILRGMRMRQSISEIEEAFFEEIEEDRERRERLRRHAEQRSRRRHAVKTHRSGTLRFVLVLLTLIATAVIVAWAMFQTLYIVMN